MPVALALTGGLCAWVVVFTVSASLFQLDTWAALRWAEPRVAEMAEAARAVRRRDTSSVQWSTGVRLLQVSAAAVVGLLGLAAGQLLPRWSGSLWLAPLGALMGWQGVRTYIDWVVHSRRRAVEENLAEVSSLVTLLLVRGLDNAVEAAARLAPGPVSQAIQAAQADVASGIPWLSALRVRLGALPGVWTDEFLDALAAAATSSELCGQLLGELNRRMLEERYDRCVGEIKSAEVKGSAMVAACTALVVLLVFVAPAVLQAVSVLGR